MFKRPVTATLFGASVKLQFIICIFGLWKIRYEKVLTKKNYSVCIDHATPCWPFPWKFWMKKEAYFLVAIFGIFSSHKNCTLWKLSLVSKLFHSISGKNRMRFDENSFVKNLVLYQKGNRLKLMEKCGDWRSWFTKLRSLGNCHLFLKIPIEKFTSIQLQRGQKMTWNFLEHKVIENRQKCLIGTISFFFKNFFLLILSATLIFQIFEFSCQKMVKIAPVWF